MIEVQIVSDGDGQDILMPIKLVNKFYQLLELEDEVFNEQFEDYRVDGNYSIFVKEDHFEWLKKR